MKKDLTNFIERLKELMEEQGLSNFTLSKKINCQDQAIANWLEGKYYPSCKNLLSLSEYFNCSVDFILCLTDEENIMFSDNPSSFIERYKSCAVKNKLTDYKIAKLCGIEQSTISQWINRARQPEVENLISLSKIFDCTVEYLIGRTDN